MRNAEILKKNLKENLHSRKLVLFALQHSNFYQASEVSKGWQLICKSTNVSGEQLFVVGKETLDVSPQIPSIPSDSNC